MKKLVGIFLSLLVSLSFATTDATTEQTSKTNQPAANVTNKDAETLGFLVVLNGNEIAAANEVLKHSVSKDVAQYAKTMQKDHSGNLKLTLMLSKKIQVKPLDTDMVLSLRDNGAKGLASLKALKQPEFEKAYIDAMVQGHADALNIIDTQLMPNVMNVQLKKLLTDTRTHVVHHLAAARMIQEQMQKKE